MSEKIYTFWEGEMPEYLKLCIDTWKFPFVILNYNNLRQYTEQIPEKVKQLSLPKIADYVRVHVLRDNGGYWLDVDTIFLTNELPKENILGFPETRGNTIGYLNTTQNSDMYIEWCKFQENTISSIPDMKNEDITNWDVMGNRFTDTYLKDHTEIVIGNIKNYWPEINFMDDNRHRKQKYVDFYFNQNYGTNDLNGYKMLMLHNSWTPDYYKKLSRDEIFHHNCTLSNILREEINK